MENAVYEPCHVATCIFSPVSSLWLPQFRVFDCISFWVAFFSRLRPVGSPLGRLFAENLIKTIITYQLCLLINAKCHHYIIYYCLTHRLIHIYYCFGILFNTLLNSHFFTISFFLLPAYYHLILNLVQIYYLLQDILNTVFITMNTSFNTYLCVLYLFNLSFDIHLLRFNFFN